MMAWRMRTKNLCLRQRALVGGVAREAPTLAALHVEVLYPRYRRSWKTTLLRKKATKREKMWTLMRCLRAWSSHWVRDNLSQRLDVPLLAEKAAMSERTFVRKFTSSMGETPAHFVETLRLDQARDLLATGMSLKEIAARTGYSTGSQFSKAFDRRFGMAPLLFRELHCAAPAA
ncbi:helix-turn-helix domain-containing protein [archaeon]|nr:MAG: helix-turn-helix domain-containing protein [archaeon]